VSTRRMRRAAVSPSRRRSLGPFSDAEWGTPPLSTPLAAGSSCRWCRSTTQRADMAAIAWPRGGEDHMLVLGRILVGFLLLVLGRRLYWLFVAAVGFLYGLELAPRLLPGQSQAVIVIIALGLALLGALLAVVATKVALGLTGFVAAGGIAAVVLQHLTIESGVVALGIYFIAGIVGAVLFLLLFNAALIVLSSLAGAYLV